jgi:GNAT superfamily N-acetyltransferase
MVDVDGVVRLERARTRQAARVLARAFHDDPFYAALLPDEAGRPRRLAWLMERMLRYGLLYGHVYGTPAMEGAACWFPPGHLHPTPTDIVRSGLYALPVRLGLDAYRRFTDFIRFAEAMRARCVTGPHWYLLLLGVDPAYRGRGLGGRLMQPILAWASRDGVPCYLETENERNLDFYARHGFRLAEAGREPRRGVRTWGLLRPGT